MDAERLNQLESLIDDLRAARRRSSGVSLTSIRRRVRLNEINRELEAPDVWNDASGRRNSAARRRPWKVSSSTLCSIAGRTRATSRELFEMAPRRGRRRHAARGRGRREGDRATGRRPRVPAHVLQSGRSEQLLRRNPGRRRRHRSAGLGGNAAAPVPALLRAQGLHDRDPGRVARRRRRPQGRDDPRRRRVRLRLPAHRNRHPPPGAQVAVRLQRRAPHLVRLGVRLSRRSTTRSRSTSIRPTCASTSTAPPARAAST